MTIILIKASILLASSFCVAFLSIEYVYLFLLLISLFCFFFWNSLRPFLFLAIFSFILEEKKKKNTKYSALCSFGVGFSFLSFLGFGPVQGLVSRSCLDLFVRQSERLIFKVILKIVRCVITT